MSVRIGHLALVEQPPAAGGYASLGSQAAAVGRPASVAGAAVVSDVVPVAPPPEVSAAVGAAYERAERMWADDRELHFATDRDSGRIVIQVRDRDGNVIRTIPPSEALDVLSGIVEP